MNIANTHMYKLNLFRTREKEIKERAHEYYLHSFFSASLDHKRTKKNKTDIQSLIHYLLIRPTVLISSYMYPASRKYQKKYTVTILVILYI